ncbi:hypothetical protein [Roseibium sp.]|uniref:hypothetical protein n=1 Tax=Roseibium sp. TaxID=1936156 RepID=UPI003BAECC96
MIILLLSQRRPGSPLSDTGLDRPVNVLIVPDRYLVRLVVRIKADGAIALADRAKSELISFYCDATFVADFRFALQNEAK